eukprot:366399-Chlamydomonas_euryale.AAC.5
MRGSCPRSGQLAPIFPLHVPSPRLLKGFKIAALHQHLKRVRKPRAHTCSASMILKRGSEYSCLLV